MPDQRVPPVDIEAMAREVRAAWVAFCRGTGDTKPSHLAPWEELSAWDQEADRVIARALIAQRDAQWQITMHALEAALVQTKERNEISAHVMRQMNSYITTLTMALRQIRAEVEPVKTRRVRRNGSIKVIIDAALGEAE